MSRERELYITGVHHKTFIASDEEKTEAAAVSGVAVGKPRGLAPPSRFPIFRADRPFLFLIRDRQSGSNLFLGRVEDPTRS